MTDIFPYAFVFLSILVIMYIYYAYCPVAQPVKCSTFEGSGISTMDKVKYDLNVTGALCDINPTFCNDEKLENLNEREQDTRSRGDVPNANQPLMVASMWNCSPSHAGDPDAVIGDADDKDTAASNYHATRGKIVNLCIDDASSQHLASRFMSEGSEK